MTGRRRWLTSAYAVLSVADTVLVGLGPRGRRFHYVVKPLLMPTLAASLVDGTSSSGPVVRRVLGAQAFSWGGDVALMGTSERQFLAGVASFCGAHLAYVGAFRALGTGSPTGSRAGRAVLALSSVLVPANAVAAGRNDARFGPPVGVYGLVLDRDGGDHGGPARLPRTRSHPGGGGAVPAVRLPDQCPAVPPRRAGAGAGVGGHGDLHRRAVADQRRRSPLPLSSPRTGTTERPVLLDTVPSTKP